MAVLYSNNATSTLSASITSTQTSLSVASGYGALFPAISGSDYFYITLISSSGNEIVKVTARSADTFTVARGQDGTTGAAFSAGDKVELRIVKALLDDFKTDTRQGVVGDPGTMSLTFGGADIPFVFGGSSAATGSILKKAALGAYWDSTGYLQLTGGTVTGNLSLGAAGPTTTDTGILFMQGDTEIVFSGTTGNVTTNAVWNGAWKYVVTGAATRQKVTTTGWEFYAATSGSAGANITFGTPKATLSLAGAFNTVGAITQNGNQVLHAGNYSAYAMPAAGPSTGSTGMVMINLSGNPAWSDINFTYDPITGAFRALGLRASIGASAPTWNFNNILHAGNYTSYSPSLTGSGASGSWDISVTGSAGSVAWANLTGTAPNVSTFPNDAGYATILGTPSMGSVAVSGFIPYWSTPSDFGYNGATGTFTASGLVANTGLSTLTFNSNTVLHAGNYSSYALPLTGGTLSGALGVGSAGSPSYGTTGQVLTSNGAGAAPSWTTVSGGGGGGITTGKAIAMAMIFGG